MSDSPEKEASISCKQQLMATLAAGKESSGAAAPPSSAACATDSKLSSLSDCLSEAKLWSPGRDRVPSAPMVGCRPWDRPPLWQLPPSHPATGCPQQQRGPGGRARGVRPGGKVAGATRRAPSGLCLPDRRQLFGGDRDQHHQRRGALEGALEEALHGELRAARAHLLRQQRACLLAPQLECLLERLMAAGSYNVSGLGNVCNISLLPENTHTAPANTLTRV